MNRETLAGSFPTFVRSGEHTSSPTGYHAFKRLHGCPFAGHSDGTNRTHAHQLDLDPATVEHLSSGEVAVAQSWLSVDDARRTTSFATVRFARIVEVHVRRLSTRNDVESLHAQVLAAVRRAGPGALICADHRFASPLSSAVADVWSRHMRGNNDDIARAALLLDPANTMYNLQVERVVHCAGSRVRRLFADIDELRAWVGEALTKSEREALRGLFSGD
jgi:hypothetical protein